MSLSSFRIYLIASLCLLCFPAVALAQPELDPETNEGLPYYATVGKKFEWRGSLVDNAVCTDNTYNEDTDEDVDVRGDDYGMAGIVATLQSQPQSGGDWTPVATDTIARDDIEVECYDGEGAAYVEVTFSALPPEVRSNYRIQYVGGSANTNLIDKPSLLFPLFPTTWKWKNSKKRAQVTVTTDPRLIGIKAVFLLATKKMKTFKPVKTTTIKKKGSKGYLKITQSIPASAKGYWRGYVCLNYQAKYPLMNTGNACPTKAVSATEMEKLFPYSTQGGV